MSRCLEAAAFALAAVILFVAGFYYGAHVERQFRPPLPRIFNGGCQCQPDCFCK